MWNSWTAAVILDLASRRGVDTSIATTVTLALLCYSLSVVQSRLRQYLLVDPT